VGYIVRRRGEQRTLAARHLAESETVLGPAHRVRNLWLIENGRTQDIKT